MSDHREHWRECATSKIRQIERLRPLVGPAFTDDPNTDAVIDAAEERLREAEKLLARWFDPAPKADPDSLLIDTQRFLAASVRGGEPTQGEDR